MEIVIAKGGVTLGTFPLPRVVSRLQTLETEHVETLGQDGVFLPCVAAWTGQLCLKQNTRT